VDAHLHPDVERLAFLLGTWRGRGTGGYPTVEPFTYDEELEFTHVDKPYLVSRQRTWRVVGEERPPSHMELAFWRPTADGTLEVVAVHANGIAEVETGTIDEGRIELVSVRIAATPTAKDVTRLERVLVVEGDALTYDLRMAAVGRGVEQHLHAELRR
jgi:THAP4-like, heme-binding beta-barrel domain